MKLNQLKSWHYCGLPGKLFLCILRLKCKNRCQTKSRCLQWESELNFQTFTHVHHMLHVRVELGLFCFCLFFLLVLHAQLKPPAKVGHSSVQTAAISVRLPYCLSLSPAPSPLFFLPILLLHKICSSSSLPPPSALLCLLCSSILFLLPLQPLMTCLKPTVGNTVRQGMEALPSHRPSQQAAVQGKVHARHMVHTLTTHKHTHSQWAFFKEEKRVYSQLQMILQSRVSWRKVCICKHVILLSCANGWVHAKGRHGSEKHAPAPPHLLCFFLLAGLCPTNSGNWHLVQKISLSALK